MGLQWHFSMHLEYNFFVYIVCKNCRILSLNSSGAYSYNSELMLSSPGILPFFINFKAFLIHLMLLKYLCNCMNSLLILVHLCVLCFIIFHSIEEIHFQLWFLEFSLFRLYPCLFVLKFCTLKVESYMFRV
jgi:hypothetical protein